MRRPRRPPWPAGPGPGRGGARRPRAGGGSVRPATAPRPRNQSDAAGDGLRRVLQDLGRPQEHAAGARESSRLEVLGGVGGGEVSRVPRQEPSPGETEGGQPRLEERPVVARLRDAEASAPRPDRARTRPDRRPRPRLPPSGRPPSPPAPAPPAPRARCPAAGGRGRPSSPAPSARPCVRPGRERAPPPSPALVGPATARRRAPPALRDPEAGARGHRGRRTRRCACARTAARGRARLRSAGPRPRRCRRRRESPGRCRGARPGR